MRLELIASALLATAACASAVPRYGPQEPSSEEERATARAEEQHAAELEQALSTLSVGEKPPDCPRVCELADQICDLSRRICLISGRYRDDPELADRCAAAEQRCRRSRGRVPPSCSCEAR